ncbi:MAG: DEAD/DEAH box helicase family protein [Gammaproteobacteria bacterium]|nr:DEAD/DEAH box helicase family protein [Gammaproteobacteria bacterium]
MAKQTKQVSLDFAFFQALWNFYQAHRGTVRTHYRELTCKFLDYNNPEHNPKAFLRQPQFEALEVYVFLKEFLGNTKVHEVFKDWLDRKGRFADRAEGGIAGSGGQMDLIDTHTQQQYKAIFDSMRKNARVYPNYIFALTMGTGKTILMATCIFYEFILANKWPKDKTYCHNALVFAPDKTVLQSLKEIQDFDLARVVPPEYANFLTMHLQFHYLEDDGVSLNTLDRSRFNVIVSNTQKIILKRQHKGKSAAEQLFAAAAPKFAADSVFDEFKDLYESEAPEEEAELTTNQRFEKLTRLEQLGIFVDEAHHAFGKGLAKDMGLGAKETDTSLRTTIDKLAAKLERAGTHVVGCYNYTGTPYVGRDVLPEVVYAYGLREAIDKAYLKKVRLHGYNTTRSEEFVEIAVDSFLEAVDGQRPEGMLPKIAFFAPTIDDLQNELRPAVEQAIAKHGFPASAILVNVGNPRLTSNDDIREFNRLDTPESDKQFVLLVNKGREGWNCRSLFGVAMFREPKSKVFVLQATMRCLRAIGEVQHTGQVYLTNGNRAILDAELQENFRISADELGNAGSNSEPVEVRVLRQEKIKLQRVRRRFALKDKVLSPGAKLLPERADKDQWAELTNPYRLIHTEQEGLTAADAAKTSAIKTEDLTHRRKRVDFSKLSLVGEIARYLNRSPLEIEDLLSATDERLDGLLTAVNEFNELLYDAVIPRLFRELYDLEEQEETEEHEVELIKRPPIPPGYYGVTAKKNMIVRPADPGAKDHASKSFHLSAYCFDSNPEQTLFWDLLRDRRVKQIFFTGMLTHGQSEFFIQYIDPDSHTVRSYYPDFVVEKADGNYVIVEVKRDDMVDTTVVQAKASYAKQIAGASGMEYRIIKGTDAQAHLFSTLLS